jgi:hypothetical protein
VYNGWRSSRPSAAGPTREGGRPCGVPIAARKRGPRTACASTAAPRCVGNPVAPVASAAVEGGPPPQLRPREDVRRATQRLRARDTGPARSVTSSAAPLRGATTASMMSPRCRALARRRDRPRHAAPRNRPRHPPHPWGGGGASLQTRPRTTPTRVPMQPTPMTPRWNLGAADSTSLSRGPRPPRNRVRVGALGRSNSSAAWSTRSRSASARSSHPASAGQSTLPSASVGASVSAAPTMRRPLHLIQVQATGMARLSQLAAALPHHARQPSANPGRHPRPALVGTSAPRRRRR